MSGPIARLYASLGLDTTGFTKGVDTAQKKTKAFTSSFKQQAMAGVGLGAGFSAGAAAFNAIGSAAQAAIGYMGDAIGLASDWEESNSKVGVVFGTMADDVRDFADTASTSMGMSERAALDALGTFGNFTQALGLTEQASVDMSRSMVQLAADLGSFNNVAADEVLLALRSGLSGEAEPMKRFGVAISAARVEAELLAMGAMKVAGAWTEAQKVQARYNIIMEDTAKAQGDFGRTADGFANTMKTIDSQLEEVQTEIGTALMPVMRDLAVYVKDDVVPVILELSKGLSGIGDVVHDLQAIVQPAASRMGDVGAMADRLGDTFGLSAVKVADLAGALQLADVALEGAGIEAAVRDTMLWGQALDRIQPDIEAWWTDLGKGIGAAVREWHTGAAEVFTGPPTIADGIEEQFAEAREAIRSGFGSLKAALKRESRPQLISRGERVENMEERQKRIGRQLHAAVEADDPWNIAYWTKAAAKQQSQLDAMRGKGRTTTADVARDFAGMGLDIQGTMFDIVGHANTAAAGVKTAFTSADMTAVGLGMMQGVATGITSGAPLVSGAAAAATAAAAGGAGGGSGAQVHFHIGTLVADKTGLRELDRNMRRASRLASRIRD